MGQPSVTSPGVASVSERLETSSLSDDEEGEVEEMDLDSDAESGASSGAEGAATPKRVKRSSPTASVLSVTTISPKHKRGMEGIIAKRSRGGATYWLWEDGVYEGRPEAESERLHRHNAGQFGGPRAKEWIAYGGRVGWGFAALALVKATKLV